MSDNFERLKQLLSGGVTPDECLFCDGNDDNLLIIGGTKSQTFNLPFEYDYIKKLVIVYVQNDNIVLKKVLDDTYVSSFDDSLLYFTLSEKETYLFEKGPIQSQMKVELLNGSIIVSDIFNLFAVDTLDKAYFVDDELELCPIQVEVSRQNVKAKENSIVVAGSEELYKCKFEFDSSWDKFSKIAFFKDEYNHIIGSLIDNKTCIIPVDVLGGPGRLYVGVLGEYNGKISKPTEWSNSVRINNSTNLINPSNSIISLPQATETTPGIMKLYQEFGDNTDGAVSQKVVTGGLKAIKFSVLEDDDKCLVLDSIWSE